MTNISPSQNIHLETFEILTYSLFKIMQEPNRGVKRSHPETPEPPKVVTR
jgi:hypothetical protein